MKYPKPMVAGSLLLAVLQIMLSSLATAQVTININQVKKFTITTGGGSLGDSWSNGFEVISENGKWNSYETGAVVSTLPPSSQTKNQKMHLLAATIPTATINIFLSSLNSIIDKFDPSAYGISPADLKADLQNKKPAPGQPDFDQLVTPETITSALLKASEHQSSIMDYGIFAEIDIIKKDGDTLKISSNSYNFGLLPWSINHTNSYDIRITNFFEAALGNLDVTNRYDAKELLWQALTEQDKRLAHYRWYYGYPQNQLLLKSAFKIEQTYFDYDGYNELITCSLKSASLPSNIIISAPVDITSTAAVKKLIGLKDQLAEMEKSNHFFFSWYKKQPADTLLISTYSNRTNVSSLSKLLQEQMPDLKDVPTKDMLDLIIHTPTGPIYGALMPDGKVVLFSIPYPNAAQNLPPAMLKNINSKEYKNYDHFALFNPNGKCLQKVALKPLFSAR